MLVKAIANFAGKVSMCIGDTKEIKDEALIKDLLRAGYIEPVEPQTKKEQPPVVVEETPVEIEEATTKKSSKKKKN